MSIYIYIRVDACMYVYAVEDEVEDNRMMDEMMNVVRNVVGRPMHRIILTRLISIMITIPFSRLYLTLKRFVVQFEIRKCANPFTMDRRFKRSTTDRSSPAKFVTRRSRGRRLRKGSLWLRFLWKNFFSFFLFSLTDDDVKWWAWNGWRVKRNVSTYHEVNEAWYMELFCKSFLFFSFLR